MVFAPVWMEKLIFPWHFRCKILIFPWYSQYLDSNSLDPKLFMPTVFGIENDSIALNNTKSWYHLLIEGSLEVKLPTIWTDEKQSRAEAERRERLEERRSEKRKSQKKEDADARKGRKVAKHCVFQWFGAPKGRTVGWLKRRVRSQLARWAMKKCTLLWREAHFDFETYKTHQRRSTFGSSDVEKVHAVLARSTLPSQNVQNTPGSDHFWKFRCRKSARRCGAKHITKSKCTKHTILGPLLEVQMSKKCTPLRREAHFQVKMCKTTCSRHFWRFGCWKSARRCGAKHISKSKCTKHKGSDHFWRFWCRFASLRVITLHYTLHYTTVHYTTLHNTTTTTTELHNYTPLHSNTLNYNTLRHITLHSTTLHYMTLHYTLHYTTHTVHYTTLHSTTLQLQLQKNRTTPPLHTATPNYTTLHYTTLERSIDRYIENR